MGAGKPKTQTVAFRIDRQLFDTIKNRAEITDKTITEYLKVLIDSFAGLSALELSRLTERRDDLRQEVRKLLDEVSALELEQERLVEDREVLR